MTDPRADTIRNALGALNNRLRPVYFEAIAALDGLLADATEQRERLDESLAGVRVYCVGKASDGTPLGSVKLLGDPEAVAPVVAALGRVAELEAALRQCMEELEELGSAYTRLRKLYEPPYARYLFYSLPGARAALAASAEEQA